MKKVVYLPLDDRPCNYVFPSKLFNTDLMNIDLIDKEKIGSRKNAGNYDEISSWLMDSIKNADALVLSIDMLVYGGLVPARIHNHSLDVLLKRLEIIKEIKSINPKLIIYGFSLIMRCPNYNTSYAEMPYYGEYGKSIHHYGQIKHKKMISLETKEELQELENINIPDKFLNDFKSRREKNLEINLKCIDYIEKGFLDFLVIPQDDSSEYGWTSMDQEQIWNRISDKSLMTKVYMYPGADELGMTLMARYYNEINNLRPKILIKYPSITSGQIIPNIEDRFLDTMVKYHISVVRGIVVNSLEEADAVLFINAPADRMLSRLSYQRPGRGMTANRNMVEVFDFLEYARNEKQKEIIIADVAYGNGSDLEVYKFLEQKNMLFNIAAYAGWNTASNTVGSAISQGVKAIHSKEKLSDLEFLILRYIDDIAYTGYVRQELNNIIRSEFKSISYDDIGDNNNQILLLANNLMCSFIEKNMSSLYGMIDFKKISFPWNRLYEADFSFEIKNEFRI